MAGKGERPPATHRTMPLFFKNNDVGSRDDDFLSILEICLAAERVSGPYTIIGAQRIRNLCRLYVNNVQTRDKLLVEGMSLRGLSVDLLANNPYIRDPDIPLSYSNDNIKTKFTSMGYKLTSKVIDELCRDSDGKLTRFLTGRRYFMERPQRPCPDVIEFGLFTGKVYHKEQAYSLPLDPENTIQAQPDRPVTFDGS